MSRRRVFIAGATGAIGLPLVRALHTLGHQVIGMTRAGPGFDRLRELGAEASTADAFDAKAVLNAMEAAAPGVVIDQLTWLPPNPADLLKSLPNDTRLRRDGGANLLSAAQAVGVGRYIIQSRGFYLDAPKGQLADETAKLRYDAPGEIGKSARAMGEYEERVLATPSLDGVVLRYGFFNGPGTWYRPDGAVADQVRNGETAIIGEGNAVWSFIHIDDAIAATVASLTAEPGVYNIVDDDHAGFCAVGGCTRAATGEPGRCPKDCRRGSGLLSYQFDRSLQQARQGEARFCATAAPVEGW